jgi:TetR/AcrR family transcriptional regulator
VKRIAGDTRTAILAAAATEFAAHGFAGASVDAIAARSRFNKAMIYYHFKSKKGLYVEILRDGFRAVGDSTAVIADSDRPPAAKVEGFIDAFNEMAATRPYMPPMMMREMAEGAVRLDHDTLRLMSRVFGNLRQILEEGHRVGAFRPANPVLTYFTLVSPVIFFRASAPVREALARQHVTDLGRIDADSFVAHLKSVVLGVLAAIPSTPVSAEGRGSRPAGLSGRSARPARRKHIRSSRPGDHA